jgi:hypothetical protein
LKETITVIAPNSDKPVDATVTITLRNGQTAVAKTENGVATFDRLGPNAFPLYEILVESEEFGNTRMVGPLVNVPRTIYAGAGDLPAKNRGRQRYGPVGEWNPT